MKRISRLLVLAIVLVTVLVPLLSACNNPTSGSSGGDKLVVYNWEDYIDPDILDDFADYYREVTGRALEITYTTFDTNETMMTKVLKKDANVDLICPSEYAIEKLMTAGMVKNLTEVEKRLSEQFDELGITLDYMHGNVEKEVMSAISNMFSAIPVGDKTLDMTEYMEKQSVARLIGAPPGYVGHDEGGQLTEKVRRKPYSVVLFDEIEKAHPDVLNILLQILDDGEVTDAHGRKVNFENTVIVMTSNAGSGKAAGAVGFGRSADDQDKERVMKALQEFLRPEFINRVDEIVYFHQLTEENFRGIAGIMLEELKAALEEKGYHFTYDDALVDYLVKKSYSAAYGARNLRRCIQKDVEDPMAARIIESYETPITQIKATAEDGAVELYTL